MKSFDQWLEEAGKDQNKVNIGSDTFFLSRCSRCGMEIVSKRCLSERKDSVCTYCRWKDTVKR